MLIFGGVDILPEFIRRLEECLFKVFGLAVWLYSFFCDFLPFLKLNHQESELFA